MLLVVLLWWLGPMDVLVQLREADGALVFAAVLLVLPLVALKAVRWLVMLRRNRIAISPAEAALIYLSGLFLGFVTPGRAGELAKAVLVGRRRGVAFQLVLPSVLADRLCDVYVLLIFALCGLIVLWGGGSWPLLALTLLLLGAVSAVLWLLLSAGFAGAVRHWADSRGRVAQSAAQTLEQLRAGLIELRGRALVTCLGLTLASYVLFFGQCELTAQALGLDLPIGHLVVAVAVANMAGFVPLSIGNLGTREAVILTYFSSLGIATVQALGFSLLLFLVFNVTTALLGAVAWWFAAR